MAEPRTQETRLATGLHVCPVCTSELVQPVSWAPAALDSWQVDLRCPNCEWTGRAIAAQDEVDDFDVLLDDAAHAINQALMASTGAGFDVELQRLLDSAATKELPSHRR